MGKPFIRCHACDRGLTGRNVARQVAVMPLHDLRSGNGQENLWYRGRLPADFRFDRESLSEMGKR
jgi:hypothetical protein